MNRRRLNLRQASAAGICASLVSGVATFVLFRLSVEVASLAAVGAWALIQGVFLIARISDIGTGANITRAVAQPLKSGEQAQIGTIVSAGLILSSLPVAAIGLIITPIIIAYVSSQYETALGLENIVVLSLLSLLSGVLASIAAVTMSALEGAFRIAFRSWTTVIANCVAMGIAIPMLGAIGIAALGVFSVTVPLIQSALCGGLLFKIAVKNRPTSSTSLWNTLRSLWMENLSLSAMGLCRLSFEPATKLLLSFIAPLAFIAVFELALRVSTLMRVTVQAATQPLLAMGVRSKDKLSDQDIKLFADAQVRLAIVAAVAGSVSLIAAPLISVLGFGSFEPIFMAIFSILVVANMINAFGLVGYYFLVSGGKLRYLLVVHLLMMAINVLGGAAAVAWNSPLAVILSYAAAFGLGGIMSYTALRSALPQAPFDRRAILRRIPTISAALIWLIVALTAEVILLPHAEHWALAAAAIGASLLMLVISMNPLKRALGRTKEA